MPSLFSAFTRPPPAEEQQQPPSRPPPTPQQRTEEARAAFEASLKSAGGAIDNDLQARAKNIHENALHLNEQDKNVQTQTSALKEEVNEIEKAISTTEMSLQAAVGGHGSTNKGTADQFEDEIARLEQDLDLLDNMLDAVEEEQRSELEDGAKNNGDLV